MRKYVLRTLAFAALFCMLLTASVYAESAEVTGNEVNFRTGPGTDYSVYDCLPRGTVVTVTDRSDSEWYGVTYDGHSGFIYATYLRISDSSPAETAASPQPSAQPEAPAETPAPQQSSSYSGTVNAMYVRLRSGPSMDHSILGEYNSGTSVTVTGTSDSWYAVTVGGQSGYMYADYVTISENAAPAPVEVTPAPTPEPTPEPAPEPTPAPQSNGGVTGHIRGDYVNFRTGPSSNYSILDTYNDGTQLTITGTIDGWCAVTINGREGFVYSSYVVSDGGDIPQLPSATPEPAPEPTPEPVQDTGTAGYITGNTVRFRSGPSTRDDILDELNYGTVLTITGRSGEWTAVVINGQAGYVYSQYVAEGAVNVIADDPNASELGKQIVQYALQYEGSPYVWGGTSPDGFDCSGFTTYVYGHFGISLHRVADDQTQDGVHVDNSALQPGDLLCFYSGGSYVGHVGIYIGNNKFIHASTYTTGVIISELSGYYDTRGFTARRLV